MEKEKIIALIEGYAAGTLTEPEELAFLRWYSDADLEEFHRLLAECSNLNPKFSYFPQIPEDFKMRLEREIRASGEEADSSQRILSIGWLRRTVAAAVIILIVTAGVYFLLNKKNTREIAQTGEQRNLKNDIAPGTNRAMLILSNGSSITLDSVGAGTIARQGAVSISKTDSGKLSYSKVNEPSAEVFYNVLTTPRGGQYQLELPDGSRVWLNAASSIKYPTVFKGRERKVTVTGEAYFEVFRNASMPFKVDIDGKAAVEVLGTHFNINAYEDEREIRTTLLEGAVKMTTGDGQSQTLKPGEQARMNTVESHSPFTIDHSPDLDGVMAWKNGEIALSAVTVNEVMRQISRWYDVDVQFSGQVKPRSFNGLIDRNVPLSTVLSVLSAYGIKSRLDGKTLTISD